MVDANCEGSLLYLFKYIYVCLCVHVWGMVVMGGDGGGYVCICRHHRLTIGVYVFLFPSLIGSGKENDKIMSHFKRKLVLVSIHSTKCSLK